MYGKNRLKRQHSLCHQLVYEPETWKVEHFKCTPLRPAVADIFVLFHFSLNSMNSSFKRITNFDDIPSTPIFKDRTSLMKDPLSYQISETLCFYAVLEKYVVGYTFTIYYEFSSEMNMIFSYKFLSSCYATHVVASFRYYYNYFALFQACVARALLNFSIKTLT